MRLGQISYFLSVAEHGNITAAARSLYISQPALSKQITLLEQEIGLPLFERQARGVTLTRAGMQFQKDLKNILKELENAKKNAVLAGRAQKPLLNIGWLTVFIRMIFFQPCTNICERQHRSRNWCCTNVIL